ncbi:translation initiation factor [Candidatus Protochlamydia phocaeensis]|uniref:translation initiation factor n=1 Tax=Candidatus Protochlamydia phocaeensis TaxID=1414722 RepID=UPI0008384B48|nr:translation initiation factor [Candidatus Protochlamydia phocaeensis]
MPFTIGGEWIPENLPPSKPKHPIKVVKEKRGSSLVTLLLNLPLEIEDLKHLCSTLKQRLGCGGAVKENHIELQGDKVQAAKDYLKTQGMKVS